MTALPAVVVGHDGHPHAEHLVDTAADEATRLGLPLMVLALVPSVDDPDYTVSAQRRKTGQAAERTAAVLGETLARVRHQRPEVSVSTRSLVDPDDAEVRDILLGCRRLVLGSYGPGRRPAFAMDTVSQRLLKAADGPVLVVPVEHAPRRVTDVRRVVAGVPEEREEGTRVVAAALAEAHPSGRLTVIHSYRCSGGETPDAARARAERWGAELVLTAATATEMGVDVDHLVTTEPPAEALAEQAAEASTLVIGSRGPLALSGMTLDSVSHRVLELLPCPVLVVPQPG